MLSEKGYWVILIVAFAKFSLLIWFWLIPSARERTAIRISHLERELQPPKKKGQD